MRVDLERRPGRQPGLAVGVDRRCRCRRASTSAITSSPAARAAASTVLEGRVAGRAVALEERDLRLDDARPGRPRPPRPAARTRGRPPPSSRQPPGVRAATRAGRCRRRAARARRRRSRSRAPKRRSSGRHPLRCQAAPPGRSRSPAGCARRISPRCTSNERDGRAELGDRGEQRLVGRDRRRADLEAVGAGAAAARRVDHDVDLARVDEVDDRRSPSTTLLAHEVLAHAWWPRMPLRASTSAVPSVATMSKPSCCSRSTGSTIGALVAVGDRDEDGARLRAARRRRRPGSSRTRAGSRRRCP